MPELTAGQFYERMEEQRRRSQATIMLGNLEAEYRARYPAGVNLTHIKAQRRAECYAGADEKKLREELRATPKLQRWGFRW